MSRGGGVLIDRWRAQRTQAERSLLGRLASSPYMYSVKTGKKKKRRKLLYVQQWPKRLFHWPKSPKSWGARWLYSGCLVPASIQDRGREKGPEALFGSPRLLSSSFYSISVLCQNLVLCVAHWGGSQTPFPWLTVSFTLVLFSIFLVLPGLARHH